MHHDVSGAGFKLYMLCKPRIGWMLLFQYVKYTCVMCFCGFPHNSNYEIQHCDIQTTASRWLPRWYHLPSSYSSQSAAKSLPAVFKVNLHPPAGCCVSCKPSLIYSPAFPTDQGWAYQRLSCAGKQPPSPPPSPLWDSFLFLGLSMNASSKSLWSFFKT